MSRKKSTAGSTTMTLKDFHGGSIPSDLLLPSAPGISARLPDRPSSWIGASVPTGASTGARTDPHRPRPGSSGGIPRVIDERGPAFLSSPSFIGRHFDEDERKPFEASSAPRRPSMVAPEPNRAPPITSAHTSAPLDSKGPVSSSVVAHHLSPSPGVSTSSAGNAWAAKKEASGKGSAGTEVLQPQPSVTLSGPAAASRFAQASAVEKVSSGRWQSKPADVELTRFQEGEIFDRKSGEKTKIGTHEEGNVGRDLSYYGVNESKIGSLPSDGRHQGRVISPLYSSTKEMNASGFHSDLSLPVSHERNLSSSAYHQTLDETSERPKLKLLPRTKPLESSDLKGYLYPGSLKHVEEVQDKSGAGHKMKPGVGDNAANRPAERPKLNLKPRSQPFEPQDELIERERNTVFGGARPREFVLKERDTDASDNPEITAPAYRAKPDVLKVETKADPPSFSFNRSLLDAERRDNRPTHEIIIDANQRNSWRNENRRNPRETEKKPAEVERLPEPETWRKPAEPPKPQTPPGPRVVKASSALELAQAFSRSMSDSRVDNTNHYSKQKILSGRTQIPFSRLTDAREIYSGSTHRRINGY